METGVEKIDKMLSPAKLKEFAKGANGEYVTLVDIEHTKTLLRELADKYEGLEVTRENYKKEGADAERELRTTRYAIQNIHKSNNQILNDVKRAEKETYDELIEITKPVEEKIYNQLNAIKEIVAKEKEAEKKAEEERIAKIEKALREVELSLEKAIAKAKNQEDLKEYDKFLEELSESFSEFQDFEFQAKRLQAVYQGRRGEVIAQIEKYEQEEKEREELRIKLEKESEVRKKVAEHREQHLVKSGFQFDNVESFIGFGLKIGKKEIEKLDEVEWYTKLEDIEKAKKKQEQDKEAEQKKQILEAKEEWKELLVVFEGLGGNVKDLKLKKAEIPTQEDIERLKRTTIELQRKKKAEKLERVKEDIEPFKCDVMNFMSDFDKIVAEKEFKAEESKELMQSFSKGMENLVNEIFGGVVNS